MALCMKPEFQRTLDKQRRKIVKLGDEVLKREEDVIALRKKDRAERQEEATILTLYMTALGS